MKKRYFFLIIAFVLLAACDPIYGYKYEVENLTESTLVVEYLETESIFVRQYPDSLRRIRIAPNTKKAIFLQNLPEASPNQSQSRIEALQHLRISKADTIFSNVDFLQSSRWALSQEKNPTLYVYRLQVQQGDF
ncbi:hypothetical protein [Hugenholtzia roseola]|uniref:hypothetical protein n=1 Tax=Hugenholtzia roseola TaxID=1002 RepID=UPI00042843FA|nr:hypothetical protein [Hugenholtzia roseola]